ncbi:MAG TPA: hypothetical protein VFT74_17570, partial [Isosphaeraceae bacterium]|nr:hypothetical protein [Isosphaeraceae bacterium]
VPNREVGPVLMEGKTYTLVVDPSWPDARNRPLKAGKRMTFRVGPPDRTSPDPKQWTLSTPKAGTREPLVIDLKEPVDRPQAERLVVIQDTEGSLAGSTRVDAGGTHLRFEPDQPWQGGTYRVVVGTVLEDPSGNSIERPFEVDLFQVDSPEASRKSVSIPFEIESP